MFLGDLPCRFFRQPLVKIFNQPFVLRQEFIELRVQHLLADFFGQVPPHRFHQRVDFSVLSLGLGLGLPGSPVDLPLGFDDADLGDPCDES
jgi:hypothetical protein